MRGVQRILPILLVSLVVAGCVSPTASVDTAATPEDALVTLDYPIRVVTVGFGSFDADAFLAKIPERSPLVAGMRYYVTGSLERESLQYDVRYEVVEAPEAFAKALFAYAATVSEEDAPDAWLASYDRAHEARVCEPGALSAAPSAPVPVSVSVGDPTASPCEMIQRIDAKAIELWIHENRAAHGLSWEGPGETLFVLDSYTEGWLPKDNYHQYFVDDGTGVSRLKNLRAWGGEHGFLYLDVGAAPNAYDYRPWIDFTAEEYGTQTDPPIWELAGDSDAFYENLAWNVHDAVDMVWARDPIYPFEHAEKYVLKSYVVIDTLAHANPASPLAALQSLDYEELTDEETIQRSFQALTPWAQVELNVTYIYLPDDDPGLAAALADAKERESTDYVDFGILKRHIREHWDEYAPDVPGARVYPTFAFVLGAPSKGLYAYSDWDETGRSFATFFNVADAVLCAGPYARLPVCFTEDWLGDDLLRGLWNGLFVHEVGHSFGLMHPHDTFVDPESKANERMNWLWDSTSTPMTYRHFLHDFAAFDVDLVHRGNAVDLAEGILRDASSSDDARAGASRALDLVRAGDYGGALAAAAEAARANERLTAAAIPAPIGEPVTLDLTVATGLEPIGAPASLPTFLAPTWAIPFPVMGPFQEFPIDWPEGAPALQVEIREIDAPTHRGWSAIAFVFDKEGDTVALLTNNGYDKAIMLDRARCEDGCTGQLIAISGVNTAYEVTLTPMEHPEAK